MLEEILKIIYDENYISKTMLAKRLNIPLDLAENFR